MRIPLSIFLFFCCATVMAQQTVITYGKIPLGIRVLKSEYVLKKDMSMLFNSDDTESEKFHDISQLCSGFDELGVPENLILPHGSQIILFLPTITKDTQKNYWYNWAGNYTNTLIRDFSYSYKGKQVAFLGAKMYSAGASDNLHVLRTVATVEEGRQFVNLEYKVDLALPKIEEIYMFNEMMEYSESRYTNDLEIPVRSEYEHWIKQGYADSLGQNGLPINPIFPSDKTDFFVKTSLLSPTAEIYLAGGGSYTKIDKDFFLSDNTLVIGSLVPGSYRLIIEEPDKVYGKKFAQYGFTIQKPGWERYGYWVVGTTPFLILAFIVYRYITRRKLKNLALLQKISDAELKAIRAQLNPHFLFNALNAIQNLVNKQDTEVANEYIVKLSRLLRTVLAQSDDTLHSLGQELEISKLYIELEQMRTPFTFEMSITEHTDQNVLVPSMILQPYLENAVIHGIVNGHGDHIRVSIFDTETSCLLEVEDNGKGSDKNNGNGKGMSLGKERLDIIARQLGDDIKMDVVAMKLPEGGFRVTIEIPKDL